MAKTKTELIYDITMLEGTVRELRRQKEALGKALWNIRQSNSDPKVPLEYRQRRTTDICSSALTLCGFKACDECGEMITPNMEHPCEDTHDW